jgi:hypothetical protein
LENKTKMRRIVVVHEDDPVYHRNKFMRMNHPEPVGSFEPQGFLRPLRTISKPIITSPITSDQIEAAPIVIKTSESNLYRNNSQQGGGSVYPVKRTIEQLRRIVTQAIESKSSSTLVDSLVNTTTTVAADPVVATAVQTTEPKKEALSYDPVQKILSCNGTLEVFNTEAKTTTTAETDTPPSVMYPLTLWGPSLQYYDAADPGRLMSCVVPTAGSSSSSSSSLCYRLSGDRPEDRSPYYAFYNLLGIRGRSVNNIQKNGPGGFFGWDQRHKNELNFTNNTSPGKKGGFVFHQDNDFVGSLHPNRVRVQSTSLQFACREEETDDDVSKESTTKTSHPVLLPSPHASTFFSSPESNGTSMCEVLTLNGEYIFRDADDYLTIHLQTMNKKGQVTQRHSGMFFLTVTSVGTNMECLFHTNGIVSPRGAVRFGTENAMFYTKMGLTASSAPTGSPFSFRIMKERGWNPQHQHDVPKRFRYSVWMFTDGMRPV